MPARLSTWLDRWGPILPLLFAEFVVWLGFGGLLPILPLYLTDQGIDLATLGLVMAAWPAARLVSEPIFGWIADRTARVPLMVVGLVVSGVFGALPLFVSGAGAFLACRAASGLGAAIYDPAARGYMSDATPDERRGEAFGLYGAAQMGGLLFGPAIGALGASLFGGIGFVFIATAVSAMVGAVAIWLRVDESAARMRRPVAPATDLVEFPSEAPIVEARRAQAVVADVPGAIVDPAAPTRLLNRGLIAMLVIQFAGSFSGGTYEVIWSLFLQGLGADLALIGLTFAMFGLPVLLLSPMAGRFVDRRGAYAFIVAGMILPAVAGILYTRIEDPVLAVPLILVEATGFAFLWPALFTVVAANSPAGRSSTAQGLFGAAGTLGFIVASLAAGALATVDILYPFYVFVAVMLVGLVLGLVIGGPALRRRPMSPNGPHAVHGTATVRHGDV